MPELSAWRTRALAGKDLFSLAQQVRNGSRWERREAWLTCADASFPGSESILITRILGLRTQGVDTAPPYCLPS
eukprot:1579793-Rhodomonas_salina.1